jgi:hypothetical protein
MECRPGCGACCIAPSISSPIPGMPDGKPAGVRCIQLDNANGCMIFGKPERPAVCLSLPPAPTMCGQSHAHAMFYLQDLEAQTQPAAPSASSLSIAKISMRP